MIPICIHIRVFVRVFVYISQTKKNGQSYEVPLAIGRNRLVYDSENSEYRNPSLIIISWLPEKRQGKDQQFVLARVAKTC